MSCGNDDQNVDDIDEDQVPDDDEIQSNIENQDPHEQEEDTHGVAAKDGADVVKKSNDEIHEEEEEDEEEDGQGDDDEGGGGEGEADENNRGMGYDNAIDGDYQLGEQDNDKQSNKTSMDDTPNPYRDPGDIENLWHRKLDMIQDNEDTEGYDGESRQESNEEKENDNSILNGAFEYASKDQASTSQVLGSINEEEVKSIEKEEQDKKDKDGDVEGNGQDEDTNETVLKKT